MEGRKIIQWGLAVVGVAVIVGYSFFVLDDFVRGPRIVIESPLNGFSTTTPVIEIIGRGVRTNNLEINGTQIAVDLNGNFQSKLILAPGYNIIKVTAKDNYERTVEKTIEMVLTGERDGTFGTGGTFDMGAGTGTTTTTQATTTINNQF